MHRVFDGIGAESGTDSLRIVHLGLSSVCRTAHCLPFCEGVVTDEGQTGDHVRLEEVGVIRGGARSVREESCGSLGVESGHFHVADGQAGLVDRVDNFTGVSVHVGFDQRERGLLALAEVLSGENIAIVHQLELSRVNCNGGANKQLLFV